MVQPLLRTQLFTSPRDSLLAGHTAGSATPMNKTPKVIGARWMARPTA
jgi:hypothetical protein